MAGRSIEHSAIAIAQMQLHDTYPSGPGDSPVDVNPRSRHQIDEQVQVKQADFSRQVGDLGGAV